MPDTATANTAPIFSKGSLIVANGLVIATANTTRDLTSGTKYLIGTAGSEGAFVEKIIAQPLGTNTATVMRFWLNNGSNPNTATNNQLLGEVTCAGTTASEVAKLTEIVFTMGYAIPAGYTLYVT